MLPPRLPRHCHLPPTANLGTTDVCSINLFVFSLSGVFYITPFDVDMIDILMDLHHWRGLLTSGQSTQLPLAWLISVSWVFSSPRGYDLIWERSMYSWTNRFWTSCLVQGVVITLFFVLPLKEIFGLLKAITELGMINVPSVSIGIYSDCQTIGVGWKSCWTLMPIIFDWPLFLVPLLICFGGGEDMNNQRWQFIHLTWLLTYL